jgi:hypothetical protein
VTLGAWCDYSAIDPCLNGVCLASGLCGPSTPNRPTNDQCGGIVNIPIDPGTGDGSVSGSTRCALNDYSGSCGGWSANDVTYRYTYTVGTEFQLYGRNVVLDGGYDTVLYAEGTCGGSPYRHSYCNDNCVSDSATSPLNFNCASYGLAATDSGFPLIPEPMGTTNVMDLIVDGAGAASGNYTLTVDRVSFQNWRCAGLFDATAGGTFRGNNIGFQNNVGCSGGGYTGNPCDCDGSWSACGGWGWGGTSASPPRAWFSLRPAAGTWYCVQSNEWASASFFDSVVEVWQPDGCPGYVYFQSCQHINGRDGTTRQQFWLDAGEWRMVAVSPYCGGVGDYEVTITLGPCV